MTQIIPGFFPFSDEDNDSETKMNHDRYDIYVNKDYVGQKTVLGQNEDIFDLEDFLKEQGISGFQSELEGDHFHLTSPDDSSATNMKDVLNVYLQSR
jgi:capsule polysaccharide export protein KpsE/RkpR